MNNTEIVEFSQEGIMEALGKGIIVKESKFFFVKQRRRGKTKRYYRYCSFIVSQGDGVGVIVTTINKGRPETCREIRFDKVRFPETTNYIFLRFPNNDIKKILDKKSIFGHREQSERIVVFLPRNNKAKRG